VNAGILIAVLVYEIVIILGVGLWLARREAAQPHGEGDFALAGRHLPVPVVAITLALTVLGTAHILGIFELAWFLGAAAVWFSLAHVILLVLVCLSTGLWVRRLGLTTVPEILDRLYGEKTRLLVSCTMAGVVFGILTIETQGIGIVISSMTGWEIRNGAIVGGILGIFYVVLAGMKEISRLDTRDDLSGTPIARRQLRQRCGVLHVERRRFHAQYLRHARDLPDLRSRRNDRGCVQSGHQPDADAARHVGGK
jgi:SSS family solute:Na+ symporter